MRRVLVCAAALALVAGGSQAAPSPDVPSRVTHHSGQPTLSGEWSAEELGLPVAEETATEVIEVARKRGGGRKGAGRGGARHKNRDGFKNGNRRNDNRHRDRDVDIDVDYDDDYGEAIVGGVIGIGIGAAIANSNDPDYVCEDRDLDGECDYDY
jgi:hypothetical protein